MTKVLIYGQFSNYWSNAGVSRGLAIGLAQNGVDVQIYDRYSNDYKGMWGKDRFQAGPSMEAPVGLYVGYPIQFSDVINDHDISIGCFIAESSLLPSNWIMEADKCDLICAPSRWIYHAFEDSPPGIEHRKLMLVSHGIHPVYQKRHFVRIDSSDGLKFLHISGARDFLDRKGTPQLIEAFARVFGYAGKYAGKAKLTIRTPPSPQLWSLIRSTNGSDIFEVSQSEDALPPEEMWKFYTRGYCALVQPSRAEAFGICPVEARALGIPVIMTHCSGHTQHAEHWDTIIQNGIDDAITVNGIPNGRAPTVTVEAIEEALINFMEHLKETILHSRMKAEGYAEQYTWQKFTVPLAKWIKGNTVGRRSRLGIGF